MKNNDPRIEQILNLIMQIASGNLKARVPTSKDKDDVDAIIQGLNMLAEDLDRTTISKNYMESIISSIPDSLIVVNADYSIKSINQTTSLLLDYRENELIGKNIGIIFENEDLGLFNEIGIQKLIEQGYVQNIETLCLSKNGNKITVLLSASIIWDDSGQFQGFIYIFHDITEHKQFEAQLYQSRKMEEIGLLTEGIAHEFKNLLSPILGYTEMLMAYKSEENPDKKYLEQIQIAGNRANILIQELFDYGQKSMSKRESVQMKTLVEETINLIKNTIPPNISVKKEIEENLPSVYGKSNEIHQVILNLCINASHAMKEGGELTILLSREGPPKFINIEEQNQKGEFIYLKVQDTGHGMNLPILNNIFDPFFTTKKVGHGSGLGLAVVKKIVENHEGYIEVSSKVGEGTTFHVYFPIALEDETLPIIKNKRLFQRNERILLIDDEPMISRLTKRMLERLGYKVFDYTNCKEALKLFAEHPLDFDLVITDYSMQNMNGKELAIKLTEIRQEIPIVLCTGHGDLIKKEEIETWGMNGLLMKPFLLEDLSEVLSRVLGKRSEEKN